MFSYIFGTLEPTWINQFRKNHTIIIGTATTPAEASVLAESAGVDLIVAQGSEAGGASWDFFSLLTLFKIH